MASQIIVYQSSQASSSLTKEFVAVAIKRIKYYLPRPCMMVSSGLIVAGLGVPFLMGLALIPASLGLGFVGMVSTCVGVVLTLYYL